jgi:transcriptional regulator with XRE-family HTH domain
MMIINAIELRAELARRNWSRRELAYRAGLSESYVRWICRGAAPSEKATRLILKALGPDGAARVQIDNSR